MRGIAFYFLCAAIIAVLVGMAWGIQMSAAGDHKLSGAHAHLNLVGWVTLSIFAFYYHLVPEAQAAAMPRIGYSSIIVVLRQGMQPPVAA